ncbi:hypothetical protein IU501_08405 [Nocardia otitidiscaviarum]|uniref:hypothetical protein n=1 Tax=Nocardia otitidiscaviarum TaxID=1823 RepID=UPI0004A761AB|nr:hypothetical protein [Nocardia otitidiscaviarum]MBF6133024.1 hypothetical protein [Nocardia otitidiscaviarum]MBF6486419.1 hypothetical protein [Nocardia otitidiscaviarum]
MVPGLTRPHIRPVVGIYKDISVQMCMVYPHEEYARTLRRIAEGTVDAASLIPDEVGFDGIAGAIEALRRPDDQIQILVRPDL